MFDRQIRSPCKDPTKSIRFNKIMQEFKLLKDSKNGKSLSILDVSTGFLSIPILIRKMTKDTVINVCDVNFYPGVKDKLSEYNIKGFEGVSFYPGSRLPFDDDSFDIVFFTDALEHTIDDPEHVMGELRRVLRVGGSLILTTPNFSHFPSRLSVLIGKQPQSFLSEDRHFRLFTMDEIMFIISKGFAIERAYCFCSIESWRFTGLSKIAFYLYKLSQFKVSFRTTIFVHAKKQ
jgi:SAM-dependent methyltransferase